MSDWFCKNSGVESGPFSFQELRFVASRGKLRSDDLVRSSTDGDWIEAANIDGLFGTPPAADSVEQTMPSPVRERSGERQPLHEVDPAPADIASGRRLERPVTAPPLRDNRQRKLLLGLGAFAMLALLLLLAAFFVLAHLPGRLASSGGGRQMTGQGRHSVGSGTADSAGRLADGESGGQSVSGGGGERVQSDEVTPTGDAEIVPDENQEPDAVSDDNSRDDPNEGGAPPPEETVPETPGFTIRKLLSAKEPEEDSILGGGQAGGAPLEMFRGRDPEKRAELVEQEGGSIESEAAVELGLKWLAEHQHKDGHWSFQFGQVSNCNGQCSGHGSTRSDTAATGLALFPFLAAGHTHSTGTFRESVRKGLKWLVEDQLETGQFRNVGNGNMYAHGQASTALCEAFAMTNDKSLRQPAQTSVDFICKAQHHGGGWRYHPGSAGDTSVMGWQIIALRSAQSAGLTIPKDVFPKANEYLDSAQTDKLGSKYSYTPGGGATPTMTAEGLLCRMYAGWPKSAAGLDIGIDYLLQNMPDKAAPNIYYWYYGTQVLHHKGGRPWNHWNEVMRDTLVDLQITEGHELGSWAPVGGHSNSGGRLYFTALALCTLEIYYRHAALYKEP